MPVLNHKLVANDPDKWIKVHPGSLQPKVVRLENGWIVVGSVRSSNYVEELNFHVSKDNGTTFSRLFYYVYGSGSITSFDMEERGNRLTVVLSTRDINQTWQIYMFDLDALTMSGSFDYTKGKFLTASCKYVEGLCISLSKLGNEAMVAWNGRTLSGSADNIFCQSASISQDGTITPGMQNQLTTESGSSSDIDYPTLARNENDEPVVAYGDNYYGQRKYLVVSIYKDNVWGTKKYAVDYPSSGSYFVRQAKLTFIPSSVNGLPNGRIVATYHGDNGSFNTTYSIFVLYSDDGGNTWTAPVLIAGKDKDPSHCQYPSISADRDGNIYVFYSSSSSVYYRKCVNGVWGGAILLRAQSYAVTALQNIDMKVVTPPAIYTDMVESGTNVWISGEFNFGATISPKGYAIGNKNSSQVLNYTITKEVGSTITKVTEILNGTVNKIYTNPSSTSFNLVIQSSLWESMRYWLDNTLEVKVEDSNNVVSSELYKLSKSITGNESSLHLIRSINDAKDRISAKRDNLASSLGMPPGSSFDALLEKIKNEGFKKNAEGSGNVASTLMDFIDRNGSFTSLRYITVDTLDFKPRTIIVFSKTSDLIVTSYTAETMYNGFEMISVNTISGDTIRLTDNAYVNSTGFRLPVTTAGLVHWRAYE